MSDPNQPYGAVPPPSFPPPGGPYGGPPSGPPGGPPGGYGGPGFPPPPGGPGGPGNKGNKGQGLWIALGIIGVLALVGVVVALVLLLTGDGDDGDADDKDSGAEPAAVVERLVDAAGDGDCDTAKTLLTEEARASDPCSEPDFQLLAAEDVESDIGEASVDGDAATVPVTFTSSQGATDYVFALEQVDGEWLVGSYEVDHGDHPTDSTDPTDSPTDAPTDDSTDGATDGPAGGMSSADAVANEPAAVVQAFLDSAFAGDCATANDLVTERYVAEEGECEMADIPSDFVDEVDYTVGTPKVSGDRATVPVTFTFIGESEPSTVTLVQVDGRWRIDEAE